MYVRMLIIMKIFLVTLGFLMHFCTFWGFFLLMYLNFIVFFRCKQVALVFLKCHWWFFVLFIKWAIVYFLFFFIVFFVLFLFWYWFFCFFYWVFYKFRFSCLCLFFFGHLGFVWSLALLDLWDNRHWTGFNHALWRYRS